MLVLAGKNNIAVNALEYILENYDSKFAVVCNRTDNGKHGWQRSLRKTALEKRVPVITIEEAYAKATIFISLEFDLIVCPEKFKTRHIYNIHFSLLPKYKGMYTSIWPIINGESVSGVTLHEIDRGIDTGKIVSQTEIKISEQDRSRDLYRKYTLASFELFKYKFDEMVNGELYGQEQPSSFSTYFSKTSLNISNLKIDLNQTAFMIKRQVYAYSFREYQLPEIFGNRIVEIDILQSRSDKYPGTVLRKEIDFIELSTVDYDIRLYFDRIDKIKEFSTCTIKQAIILLKNICGVNDRNEFGWSPIIIAAYNGNQEVVKYLLNNGANVNDTNYNGTSVLMYSKDYCLKTQDHSLFKYLIKSGANIHHKDYYGKTLKEYLSYKEQKLLGLS